MTTKYNVGDVIPIKFMIESISIGKDGAWYKLASMREFDGSKMTRVFVRENEIDDEVNNEN